MEQKSSKPPKNHSNGKRSEVFLIVIIIVIAGAALDIYLISQNKETGRNTNVNQSINNTNQPLNVNTQSASEKIKTNNGFSFVMPNNWMLEGRQDNAVNIIKFSSPMQFFNFIRQEDRGVIFGPGITASSFTIDEKLSAKDIANLSYDLKIADKIDAGTDKCYYNSQSIKIAGMGAYSYYNNTTNPDLCNIATEPYISKTVIIKNTGDQNALILTLVATSSNELNALMPDFQKVLDSVKYQ